MVINTTVADVNDDISAFHAQVEKQVEQLLDAVTDRQWGHASSKKEGA